MARRASSRLNPGIVIGAAVAITAAVFVGKSFVGKKSVSFGNLSKLSMEEYLENGNQLRGNEYVVDGQIEEKLQWTTGRGQLVSLKVETPSGEQFIGIEIPNTNEFKNLNVDAKQKYSFRVKMRQSGIAVATGVNRL